MNCSQCGGPISDGERYCPICRKEGAVKVLSKTERDNFAGDTIDAPVIDEFGNIRENNHYKYNRQEYNRYGSQNHSRRIYKFNLFPTSFFGKLAALLAVGLMFFVALPVFVFTVLLGSVIWMLFFKRW